MFGNNGLFSLSTATKVTMVLGSVALVLFGIGYVAQTTGNLFKRKNMDTDSDTDSDTDDDADDYCTDIKE